MLITCPLAARWMLSASNPIQTNMFPFKVDNEHFGDECCLLATRGRLWTWFATLKGTRIFWNHPLTSPVPPPQQYSLYTWCNYKTSELVVALKLTPKTICTCNATGWFLPFFSLLTRYHLISNVDGVVETKQAKCPSNRLHGFLKMLNVQIISIFLRLSVCPQATPRGPGKTQLGTNLTMTKLSTTCV